MVTDLERLKAWMVKNGYDELGLRNALGYVAKLTNILDGTQPIREHFKWRFGKSLGNTALLDAFGIDLENDRRCFEYGGFDRVWRKDRYDAHRALNRAIAEKLLPPAKYYKCYGCDSQAQQYHHESYHSNDHLCVVPLCVTCHRRHHTGRARLTFGVVPTTVGVVRVAIALAKEPLCKPPSHLIPAHSTNLARAFFLPEPKPGSLPTAMSSPRECQGRAFQPVSVASAALPTP